MKILITNRLDGSIIFEYECENNCIKTTLEEAVRREIKIMYADFSNCDLSGANLSGAVIHSEMVNTNLKGANLTNAKLLSNLSGANLEGVNLQNATLMGCDFSSANLSNANLKMTVLSFNNLYKTNFSGAQLDMEDVDHFRGNDVDDETNFSNTVLDNEITITNFKNRQLKEKEVRDNMLGRTRDELGTMLSC
jgi:uncharacterized protein YjbI with pentapeptide repeats